MPPAELDYQTPNTARMYDYWLGGKSHGPADRELADRLTEMDPDLPAVLRHNREFLARAVLHLAGERGIRQFLDIGTGLPTADNTHEVAHRVDPECRVVYVDNDLVVVRHAQALLAGNDENIGVVHGDLRDPQAILEAPQTRRLLDFSQPVAVMMIAILPFLTDEENPYARVRTFVDAMPPGSLLALTHGLERSDLRQVASVYTNEVKPLRLRPYADIERFFTGLELEEPGLVPVTQWRPTGPGPGDDVWVVGGVAAKR
jgi:hypothetical protein